MGFVLIIISKKYFIDFKFLRPEENEGEDID